MSTLYTEEYLDSKASEDKLNWRQSKNRKLWRKSTITTILDLQPHRAYQVTLTTCERMTDEELAQWVYNLLKTQEEGA